jgi:hypothetical protein
MSSSSAKPAPTKPALPDLPSTPNADNVKGGMTKEPTKHPAKVTVPD